VELMDATQQFIANDYRLVRGESSFQIVTGPNMVRRYCRCEAWAAFNHVSAACIVAQMPLVTLLYFNNLFVFSRAARARTSAAWAASLCWRRWAASCRATAPRSP
jgi:hypothetical protein